MRRKSFETEIERLETELRNQTFRYHLAIKDGAVISITTEVLEKIQHLQDEIIDCRTQNESDTPVEQGPRKRI